MRCADRNENDDDNNNSDHNDSTALITPVKIIIRIRMITIMTKNVDKTNEDHISINHDGKSTCIYTSTSFCGDNHPISAMETFSENVFIIFTSDGEGERSGFSCTVTDTARECRLLLLLVLVVCCVEADRFGFCGNVVVRCSVSLLSWFSCLFFDLFIRLLFSAATSEAYDCSKWKCSFFVVFGDEGGGKGEVEKRKKSRK